MLEWRWTCVWMLILAPSLWPKIVSSVAKRATWHWCKQFLALCPELRETNLCQPAASRCCISQHQFWLWSYQSTNALVEVFLETAPTLRQQHNDLLPADSTQRIRVGDAVAKACCDAWVFLWQIVLGMPLNRLMAWVWVGRTWLMLGAKMSIWPKATLSVLRRKAKVSFARGSSFAYVEEVFLMSWYGTVFNTLRFSLAQAKSLWRSKCVVRTCTDLIQSFSLWYCWII